MWSLDGTPFLPLIRMALAEDVGSGDVTTQATVPSDRMADARMTAREACVVCGLEVAEAVFREVCREIRCEGRISEGSRVEGGTVLLRVTGPAWGILTGERVALNFVQRLTAVATLTARYVAAVAGTGAKIMDTRKTTPGWRTLEKHAVRCGGGINHRAGLYDMVLIKDNHLAVLRGSVPDPVRAAVRRARARYPGLRVEVEADRLEQVAEAVEAGADVVLLDNLSVAQLSEAVALVRGRCKTEASGGINLSTIRAVAETGVDFISVGALTHSAPAMDIGLDFEMGTATGGRSGSGA